MPIQKSWFQLTPEEREQYEEAQRKAHEERYGYLPGVTGSTIDGYGTNINKYDLERFVRAVIERHEAGGFKDE